MFRRTGTHTLARIHTFAETAQINSQGMRWVHTYRICWWWSLFLTVCVTWKATHEISFIECIATHTTMSVKWKIKKEKEKEKKMFKNWGHKFRTGIKPNRQHQQQQQRQRERTHLTAKTRKRKTTFSCKKLATLLFAINFCHAEHICDATITRNSPTTTTTATAATRKYYSITDWIRKFMKKRNK